jgi:hypothetical protein
MVDESHGNTRFTDAAFTKAVSELEPVGTSKVAEYVGCTTRTADMRLKDLRERGMVNGDLIGNSLIWTVSEGDK